jgi:hypothetical protein
VAAVANALLRRPPRLPAAAEGSGGGGENQSGILQAHEQVRRRRHTTPAPPPAVRTSLVSVRSALRPALLLASRCMFCPQSEFIRTSVEAFAKCVDQIVVAQQRVPISSSTSRSDDAKMLPVSDRTPRHLLASVPRGQRRYQPHAGHPAMLVK